MTVPKSALAIRGGRPVRDKLLTYGHQVIEQIDIDAVTDVLRSDWLTTGPVVSEFERAFADYVGAAHAVAVSSGTAALHAAAAAANVRPGDNAVVPALTFVASANCIRYQGGNVRFADVRADTLNLDVDSARAAMTGSTRAIVTVDYGGQPSDLDELADMVHASGGLLIEDASHALGATYKGRRLGTIADLTTFSLHPVKQMTTGEGGVVVTNDETLAARVRAFRSHGISSDAREREARGAWHYEMTSLGFNYRLTDFQCALGLAQLSRLPAWLARRAEIAAAYARAFAPLDGVNPVAELPDRQSSWHLYVVRFARDKFRVARGEIFSALRAEGMGVNVHYIPVPWHPYYRDLGYARGQWPAAEAAYEEIITLPLWAGMTDADVDDVIAAVRKVHAAFSA